MHYLFTSCSLVFLVAWQLWGDHKSSFIGEQMEYLNCIDELINNHLVCGFQLDELYDHCTWWESISEDIAASLQAAWSWFHNKLYLKRLLEHAVVQVVQESDRGRDGGIRCSWAILDNQVIKGNALLEKAIDFGSVRRHCHHPKSWCVYLSEVFGFPTTFGTDYLVMLYLY